MITVPNEKVVSTIINEEGITEGSYKSVFPIFRKASLKVSLVLSVSLIPNKISMEPMEKIELQ